MKRDKFNLETIVTSKEMSKKLQGAGFEIETCFWWLAIEEICGKKHHILKYRINEPDSEGRNYSAYTFQQLWEVLPEQIKRHNKLYNLGLQKSFLRYFQINNLDLPVCFNWTDNFTLPDLAAKVILWCIENGYLTTLSYRIRLTINSNSAEPR